MTRNDLDLILVETTVRKALKNIEVSPRRGTRNLVDRACDISCSRFQNRFFSVAQDMLAQRTSAYFDLIEDAVSNIDHDALITFGINLGYNGCTKGAQTIRAIEAEEGFNIPWILNFFVNTNEHPFLGQEYSETVSQGENLGIFSYLFQIEGPIEEVLPLIRTHGASAFVLLVESRYLQCDVLSELQELRNVLVSVADDEQTTAVCKCLRSYRLPYAVHNVYGAYHFDEQYYQRWLAQSAQLHPLIAFLVPHPASTKSVLSQAYDWVVKTRLSQRVPVVPIDVLSDQVAIDAVISGDPCLVGFDAKGDLHPLFGGACISDGGAMPNVFRDGLKSVLEAQERRFQACPHCR